EAAPRSPLQAAARSLARGTHGARRPRPEHRPPPAPRRARAPGTKWRVRSPRTAMIEFLARRAMISVVTLLVISVIVFVGVRMIPGDPPRVLAGSDADAAGIEEIREKYGLNAPIPVQYVRWLALAVRGDLGESIRTRQPVTRTVAIKLPITLELACLSLRVAVAIAV